MLASDGWVQYVRPLEQHARPRTSRRASKDSRCGLRGASAGPTNRPCTISSDRFIANVPFPPGATNIIYDHRRPYLGCIAPAAVDATLDFFRKEMDAIGWSPCRRCGDRRALAERAARGRRSRTACVLIIATKTNSDLRKQRPIMLTLQGRDDGADQRGDPATRRVRCLERLEPLTTSPACRVPKETQMDSAARANRIKPSRAVRHGQWLSCPQRWPSFAVNSRHGTGRRDRGAVVTPDERRAEFFLRGTDRDAEARRKYDLTNVSLNTRITEAAVAAQAKARRKPARSFSSMPQQWQKRSSRPTKRSASPGRQAFGGDLACPRRQLEAGAAA